MANSSSTPVRYPDYNPQAEPIGALATVPRDYQGDAVTGTVGAIADKLSQKFGRIADQAAQIEGARAGDVAGQDPAFRPSGSTTIRGRATDQAAVEVYASNLNANLQSDMADLYLANKDNPTGFAAGAAGLRQRYLKDHVFPEVAADFNTRFAGTMLTYRTRVADGYDQKLKDQNSAAMLNGLNASQTARTQIIVGGKDPAVVRRQVGYSIADDDARIDGMVKSGAYTAEYGAKLKLGIHQEAAGGVVFGEASRLKSADDVDAYRVQLQRDFGAGKTDLDAESYPKVAAQLERLSTSMRVGVSQATNELQKQLDDINGREAKGYTAKASEWAALAAQAHLLGSAGSAMFEEARLRSGLAASVAAQPIERSQAMVDAMSAAAQVDNAPFQPPANRDRLPAGMRNNNPGNIKFTSRRAFAGVVGPSVNTDQGDPQAVFATAEDGMRAAYQLALRKYQGGKTTADQLIAGENGWTPGNHQAAANIARTAGLGPNDDLQLDTPQGAQRFMRGLLLQEHGPASGAYSDQMIAAAVSGAGGAPAADGAANPLANVGVAPQAASRLEWLRGIVDAKRKAISEDPLGAAQSDLGVTITPIDPVAADAPAQISTRVSQADAIAQANGRLPVYLRPDEKARLTAGMAQGGDQALTIMQSIAAGAGPAAPAIWKEIAGDAPVMAQAGAILAEGGSLPAVRDAMAAVKLKKDGGQLPAVPKDAFSLAGGILGQSLTLKPEEQNRISQLAALIYGARMDRNHIDPTSSEAKTVYQRAVQEAAGGHFEGGTQYGGFVDWGFGLDRVNHREMGVVALPSSLRADTFPKMIDAIRDEDLASLAVPPIDPNGKAVAADAIQRSLPVRVKGGFVFQRTNVHTDEAWYIRGADGKPFVLSDNDLRNITTLRRVTGDLR